MGDRCSTASAAPCPDQPYLTAFSNGSPRYPFPLRPSRANAPPSALEVPLDLACISTMTCSMLSSVSPTSGGTHPWLRQSPPEHFRQVLGQYPTGVVVVTALDSAEQPVGMTVGSFVSVSLDPPLVAFLPARKSSSWAALRAASDNFCINILGSDQEQICRAVASRKTNKFDGIGWQKSAQGNPVLDGSVAWIDCTVDTIHEAGDHHIVVGGEVQDLGVSHNGYPPAVLPQRLRLVHAGVDGRRRCRPARPTAVPRPDPAPGWRNWPSGSPPK